MADAGVGVFGSLAGGPSGGRAHGPGPRVRLAALAPILAIGLLACGEGGGAGRGDGAEPDAAGETANAAAAATAAAGASGPKPPNVLLIVVDTLRADHLSHYGYARPTAAPLDGFRDRATRFARAYSTAPWTGPSTMSIMTGLSTLRHRGNEHGDALPDEATTLAEHLKSAGYATHAVSFNHVVSRDTGFDQGFDKLDDFLGGAVDYPDISHMARRVEAWRDAAPREPWFLYLQPMNVHGPYRVPRSRRSTLLGREPSRAFVYWDKDLMKQLMFKGQLELREEVTSEFVEWGFGQ